MHTIKKCRQYKGVKSQRAIPQDALSAVWRIFALSLGLPQPSSHFNHRISILLSLPSTAFKTSSPSPSTRALGS